MAITPEQIVETAETLVERGESATLAAVRRELGGGSYTTISEALRGWRERRRANQERTKAVQVPAKVREALARAGVLVWTAATEEHAARLAAEREALEKERERFATERREAVELADQVSRELDEIRNERDRTAQALAEERRDHDRTRAEVREQRALTEERGRRGEALETELRELRQEAGRTDGQLEALQARLGDGERSVAELAEVKRKVEVLEAELMQSKQAAADAGAERDRFFSLVRARLDMGEGEEKPKQRARVRKKIVPSKTGTSGKAES